MPSGSSRPETQYLILEVVTQNILFFSPLQQFLSQPWKESPPPRIYPVANGVYFSFWKKPPHPTEDPSVLWGFLVFNCWFKKSSVLNFLCIDAGLFSWIEWLASVLFSSSSQQRKRNVYRLVGTFAKDEMPLWYRFYGVKVLIVEQVKDILRQQIYRMSCLLKKEKCSETWRGSASSLNLILGYLEFAPCNFHWVI